MKAMFIAAAALATLTAAIPAKAVTLVWTLAGVTFDDGGTAGGTFTTDSTTGNALTYDISTTAGSTFGAFHYDTTDSQLFGNNVFAPNSFLVVDTAFNRYIQLAFASPLTSGGANHLATGGSTSYECGNCSPIRFVTVGEATTVPEPMTWALMVTGLGGVGMMLRARRKPVALAA